MFPETQINSLIQRLVLKQNIFLNSNSEEQYWDKYWQNEISYFNKYKESRETRDYWLNRCNVAMTNHYDSLLSGFANKSIIECGGGSGINSLLMAKRGAKVTIVDFSAKSLEYAKLIARQLKTEKQAKFKRADIYHLNFDKGVYDIAWNCGVIEHYSWDKAVRFLKLMISYVKPGGQVLVTIPNLLSYEIIYRMLKEGKGSEIFYSKRQLKMMMIEAGLLNVDVEPLLFATPSFAPHFGEFLETPFLNKVMPTTSWLISAVGEKK